MEERDKNVEDYSVINGEGTSLRKAQLRLLEMLMEFDRICKKHGIDYYLSSGNCLGAMRHGGFIPWDDDMDVDVMYKDYKKLHRILERELPPQYVLQTPRTDKGYYHIFTRIVDLNSKMHYSSSNRTRRRLRYDGLFLDIFPLQAGINHKLKKRFDRFFVPVFRYSRGVDGSPKKQLISKFLWPFFKVIADVLNFVTASRLFSVFHKDDITHIYGTNILPKVKYSNVFPSKPMQFEGKWVQGPANPDAYLREIFGDYMEVPPPERRKTHAVKIDVF